MVYTYIINYNHIYSYIDMGLCGYHGMDIFNHGLIYGLIYDISRVELCYFVLYN